MADTLVMAQLAYDAIPHHTKLSAGLEHPQHVGRRVLPVLESTTLREIHDNVPEGEIVVLATVIGNNVEFGMFMGQRDTQVQGEPETLDITVRELINRTLADGEPGLEPGHPLYNPDA